MFHLKLLSIFSYNVFTDNYKHGLWIGYSVDDVISNNVFTDNGANQYNTYWSLYIGSSDGFSITGNTISSTSTTPVNYQEQHNKGIRVDLSDNDGTALVENNNISNMYQAMEISGYSSGNPVTVKNNIIDSNW